MSFDAADLLILSVSPLPPLIVGGRADSFLPSGPLRALSGSCTRGDGRWSPPALTASTYCCQTCRCPRSGHLAETRVRHAKSRHRDRRSHPCRRYRLLALISKSPGLLLLLKQNNTTMSTQPVERVLAQAPSSSTAPGAPAVGHRPALHARRGLPSAESMNDGGNASAAFLSVSRMDRTAGSEQEGLHQGVVRGDQAFHRGHRGIGVFRFDSRTMLLRSCWRLRVFLPPVPDQLTPTCICICS